MSVGRKETKAKSGKVETAENIYIGYHISTMFSLVKVRIFAIFCCFFFVTHPVLIMSFVACLGGSHYDMGHRLWIVAEFLVSPKDDKIG